MSATASSPKSSLARLGFHAKPKTFKVMVLGQSGVGKSALVVRFITRRFIGSYAAGVEQVHHHAHAMDNELVHFEILDSAGDPRESESGSLESNIRWAEAFILMYSVTDQLSFDECPRLKFLINYNKRRRRLSASIKDGCAPAPVVLVGNKADAAGERMVSAAAGRRRSREAGCVAFHELSVRESIDQVCDVFRDARRFWRVQTKCPRPALPPALPPAPLAPLAPPAPRAPRAGDADDEFYGHRWSESDGAEAPGPAAAEGADAGAAGDAGGAGAFRARASTDSRVLPPPARARHPPAPRPPRRISLALQGNNATY